MKKCEEAVYYCPNCLNDDIDVTDSNILTNHIVINSIFCDRCGTIYDVYFKPYDIKMRKKSEV